MTSVNGNAVQAASLNDLKKTNCLAVQVKDHALVLFHYDDKVYAIDNRCPHMGFPLHQGTVRDGILTCHWHHARFDLASGGTFDQWADDVRAFPAEVRDGEIYVDLSPRANPLDHQRGRLHDGLERNIPLVIAKAVIALLEGGIDPAEPFSIGLEFGTRYRREGWGQGLTILGCMMNILPCLDPEDRPRALYHGLSAVANDADGSAPRFIVHPLPGDTTDIAALKRWFREFIEVRDSEGAERCIISAIRAGADQRQMADMLFAAATDHRYITIGHPLDFTNKAFEALDIVGWQQAEQVLTSLVMNYAVADRQEESTAWRYPIDLVVLLEAAFDQLPEALTAGQKARGKWDGRAELVAVLLDDDPKATINAMLNALRTGCSEEQLASAVTYAAALRIARFHTSNEFTDWDTALHTFTFSNAVQMGLKRIGSPVGADAYIPLLRGVFDAAMSVYLDRFLNIPAAKLPQPNGKNGVDGEALDELEELLNYQQQVNEAGGMVAKYLYAEGDPDTLLAGLGKLLLREDRNFHTIQTIETAFRQYRLLRGTPEAIHVLIAAARYLAAHAPTMRAQGQTYHIAQRLSRGERLFEDEEA
jgi:nitrite reductase/ring-hydroxylating ferredoxin subunit